MPKAHLVLLAQDNDWSLLLWRAALRSQGLRVIVAPGEQSVMDFVREQEQKYPVRMLVLDLKVLQREGTSLASFGEWFTRKFPALELVVTTDARFEVSQAQRRWASRLGAAELLPALSPTLPENSVEILSRLLNLLEISAVDEHDLSRLLGATLPIGPQAGGLLQGQAEAYALSRQLEAAGNDLALLVSELAGNVTRAQRAYLGKRYANCLLGSEACTWLASRCQTNRREAAAIGQALLVRGYLHHVLKEQPFIDGAYFYRLVDDLGKIDAINLEQAVSAMRAASGLVADRSYRRTDYPACFVGAEAVDFLCGEFSLSREQALSLGQRLQDSRLLRHVVDEHEFLDDYFFYRFSTTR
jgi:hypothetical protein